MRNLILFFCLLGIGKCFGQQLSPDQVVRVPVIFHILYSDRYHSGAQGENISENLSVELIVSELEDLSRDFMLANKDSAQVLKEFKSRIGNPKIEFYLADTLLQVGGTKGIVRIKTSNNKSKLFKRSSIIDPGRYLNVYIGNIGGSYAPSSEPWRTPDRDAVYLGFDWIGQGYRLLTHEVGHWMGLLHLHGGHNGYGDKKYACTYGDGISDTPPQWEATQPNGYCDNCPPPFGKAVDKSCITGQPSNYNNFMDYSGCRKMFTVEQSKRMRENLEKFRNKLIKN